MTRGRSVRRRAPAWRATRPGSTPGDEDRSGPGRRCPREVHRWGEHMDVPERARGVVGEWLAQAVRLVGAGERGVDEPERPAPHRCPRQADGDVPRATHGGTPGPSAAMVPMAPMYPVM